MKLRVKFTKLLNADAFKRKVYPSICSMCALIHRIFSDDGEGSFRERKLLPDQKIIQTPYGCRLQYTLPHGNLLNVHFKDKQQIRHKKRWSQVSFYTILSKRTFCKVKFIQAQALFLHFCLFVFIYFVYLYLCRIYIFVYNVFNDITHSLLDLKVVFLKES